MNKVNNSENSSRCKMFARNFEVRKFESLRNFSRTTLPSLQNTRNLKLPVPKPLMEQMKRQICSSAELSVSTFLNEVFFELIELRHDATLEETTMKHCE